MLKMHITLTIAKKVHAFNDEKVTMWVFRLLYFV